MKRIILILYMCSALPASALQIGRVQFIHSLADTGPVDLYMNGFLWAADVAFREATRFGGLPHGDYRAELRVAGSDAMEAAITSLDIDVVGNQRMVLVAIGAHDVPALHARYRVREHARSVSTEFFIVHAAPDIGPIDIRLRDPAQSNRVTALLNNNLPYARSGIYFGIDARGYNFEILTGDQSHVVGSFYFNLSGFGSRPLVMVVSGRGTTPAEGIDVLAYTADAEVITPEVTTGVHAVPATGEPAAHFPNPFTDAVTLTYSLKQPGQARLTIVDLQGRHIATLVEGFKAAGTHRAIWDGRTSMGARAPGGIYFSRFDARGATHTRKLVRIP